MKQRRLFAAGLATLAVLVAASCSMYKQVSKTPDEFFSNKELVDAFSKFRIYVHDSSRTYVIHDAKLNGNSIGGSPVQVTDPGEIERIKDPGSRKEKKDRKYDLNFYTDKTVVSPVTASSGGGSPEREKFELKKEDIKLVEVNAHDQKKAFSALAVIVLLAITVLLLVGGTLLLINASQEGSDESSNASSGGSNSGSNSGGSGGSNSGCYVATMVYGSYDAPQVMVLRQFRDQWLSKRAAGRAFIKVYYKYSPRFVEKFRHHKRMNRIVRAVLDKLVNRLSKRYS